MDEELKQKVIEQFPRKIVNKKYHKGIVELSKFPTYVSEFMILQKADKHGDLHDDGIKKIRAEIALSTPEKSTKERVKKDLMKLGEIDLTDHFQVYTDLHKGKYYTQVTKIDEIATVNEDLLEPGSYEELLENGLWGRATLEHMQAQEGASVNMKGFHSFEAISTGLKGYMRARKSFNTDEWIDLIILTIGMNPTSFTRKEKLLYITRLIPLVEIGSNSLEIGPAQTGKSHIYLNVSKHVRLLLGGDITPAKLIYNKSTRQNGFVFQKDVLVFDEINKQNTGFSGIVSSLQQIMASNRVERGDMEATTDISLVFQGNPMTKGTTISNRKEYVKVLPKDFQDCAFLDRLHRYISGDEFAIFKPNFENREIGLALSYFGKILHRLRKEDKSLLIRENVDLYVLDENGHRQYMSNRDISAIQSSISGFIKLLFPHDELTKNEWQEIADLAVSFRQNIIEEMVRMDDTYKKILKVYIIQSNILSSPTEKEIIKQNNQNTNATTNLAEASNKKEIPANPKNSIESISDTSFQTEEQILMKINPPLLITEKKIVNGLMPYWQLKLLLATKRMKQIDNQLEIIELLPTDKFSITSIEAISISKVDAGTTATYDEEERNLSNLNKELKRLQYKVMQYESNLNQFQTFNYRTWEKRKQPNISELLKEFEEAKKKLHIISSSAFSNILNVIENEKDGIVNANGKTPDIIRNDFHTVLIPSKERIQFIKETNQIWHEYNRSYDRKIIPLIQKASKLGIKISNDESIEEIYNGEPFSLFAFDINNMHYTWQIEICKTSKSFNCDQRLAKKIKTYISKYPKSVALLFTNSKLANYKKMIPKSQNIRWDIENMEKRPGTIMDIDTNLAIDTATFLAVYKSQISGFYLGSGDKDFHKLISQADKYHIPTYIVGISRNTIASHYINKVDDVHIIG